MKRKEDFINDKRRVSYLGAVYTRIYRGKSVLIEGEFGVLHGHIPFLTALKVGMLSYKAKGTEKHLAVSWGYVEVTGDNVKVLAETAERATEIDVSRAKRAKETAEKILTAGKEDQEYEEAKVRLEKAVIRIQVAGRK